MEDRYGVKITFPRETTEWEGKTREQLTPDEVLVKGGKKGVAGAKAEILDVSGSYLLDHINVDGRLPRLSSSRKKTTTQSNSRFLAVPSLESSVGEGPALTISRTTPALRSMWTNPLRPRPQSPSGVVRKASRRHKL